jgi:hypothetical protein
MSPRTPLVHEDPPIWQEIFKFLRNPRKPVILAMSRPDAKKNITTLVRAYGSNRALRDIANLVLIMGNREVIDSMAPGSQKVMEAVLKLIDRYNLYGRWVWGWEGALVGGVGVPQPGRQASWQAGVCCTAWRRWCSCCRFCCTCTTRHGSIMGGEACRTEFRHPAMC